MQKIKEQKQVEELKEEQKDHENQVEFGDDDYEIYLFGKKIDLPVIQTLIKYGNPVQSILSLRRCMFCLKQSGRKKENRKSPEKADSSKKVVKDKMPICKKCEKEGKHKMSYKYYSEPELIKILKNTYFKNSETAYKLRSDVKKKGALWLEKEMSDNSISSIPMSCRTRGKESKLQYYSMDGIDLEFEPGVNVAKKKLHFECPK